MIGSISRRSTFADLRSDGRRVRHGSVRLSFLPMPEPEIAFAFSRTYGNAVERNRARRRLKAAFLEAWSARVDRSDPPPVGAYLLTGRRGLLTDGFARIVGDVGHCFESLADPPGNGPAREPAIGGPGS